MGIKSIAAYLNDHGYTQRGKAFRTAAIETYLKSEIYAGTPWFNRVDSRTRLPRPQSEWGRISVPAIVTPETQVAVRRRLKKRRPTETPPRVTNGPTLLTGLATCGCCVAPDGRRAGMMLRTGKSGQYRYLVCANRALKTVLACDAPQIRMEAIDELVLCEVEERVLAPARMRSLLQAMLDRRDESRAATETELQRQKDARKRAESGVRSLLTALATSPDLVQPDDPILREQLALLDRQRAELDVSIPDPETRLRFGPPAVSDEQIAIFSRAVRERLRSGDPAFRRQWLRLFVEEVVIGRRSLSAAAPTAC